MPEKGALFAALCSAIQPGAPGNCDQVRAELVPKCLHVRKPPSSPKEPRFRRSGGCPDSLKRAKPDAKSDDFGAVCRPGPGGWQGLCVKHAPGVGTKVNRNGERKRSSVKSKKYTQYVHIIARSARKFFRFDTFRIAPPRGGEFKM